MLLSRTGNQILVSYCIKAIVFTNDINEQQLHDSMSKCQDKFKN